MPDPRVIDPTRPQGPGTHYQDGAPTPVDDWDVRQLLQGLAELNSQLAERFRWEKIILPIDTVATGQTDDSGNATFPVYQVGAGFYASVNRLVIEAGTFDTTPITPAAPFSGGWLGMFVSQNPKSVAQGGMVDFLPTTAGGQLIPAVAQYVNGGDPEDTGGVFLRSQDYLVCNIHSGPSLRRITVHLTGVIWGAES